MKSRYLTFYFFGFINILMGQTNGLTIVIKSSTSNQAIVDAELYCDETDQLYTVDETGRVVINNLSNGNYSFTVFSFDYNTIVRQVSVPTSEAIIIFMDELSGALSEVEILARKEALFSLKRLDSVEGTSIYSGKKTEVVLIGQSASNLASNNSRQIYAQVVGLNIYDSNDAGLQLNIGGRGLDPNRTSNFNTRQNGYDISADVLGYPESYYTPPAEALSEIQVIRGAAALQYGTQFGGLVNFIMKQPNKSKALEVTLRNTMGSNALINNFLSLSGTKKKLYYYAYFLYKRGDGFRPNSEYNSSNAFVHIAYDFSSKSKFSLDYTKLSYLAKQAGGITDIQFTLNPKFSNRSRNWFEVDWNLYAAKFDHEYSKNTKFSFQLSYLDASRNAVGFRGNPVILNQNPITALDEQNQDGSYILPRDVIRGSFNNVALEVKGIHDWKIQQKVITSLLGAKYYKSRNINNQGAGSLSDDADFNIYTSDFPDYANQSDFDFPNQNVSIFSENIIRLSDKIEVTPGIRWEYIRTQSDGYYNQVVFDIAGNPIANQELNDQRDLTRKFALLGLGFSYTQSKSTQWYTNISQNYRSVTFSDIRVVNPSFIIDPDIRDESGFTLDAGVRGRYADYVSYDLGGFTILYDDRIGIVLDDRANRVRKNIGKAIIYGAEIFADWNVLALAKVDRNKYRFNTFVNVAFTNSEYTESQENNVVGKKVEFIPAVNLKTGIRGGIRNLLFSWQYSYLSQQYTDVENSSAAPLGDSRNGLIGPVPSYHVMDVSLSYRYSIWKFETGINNLSNQSYYTRRATGYPGPGIIPSDPRTWYVGVELSISAD